MKIAIIGNAGSGKSTMGEKLHKKLGISLYHLDQYYWKPGWRKPDSMEFEKAHHQLCNKEQWIIEGVATRLFQYRASKANIIIFLDIPMWLCLYRVLKRMVCLFGTVRASSAPGCPERMPDLQFLRFVWNFNKECKPLIEDILEQYSHTKRIFTVKNRTDFEYVIKDI